jgi:hypothetical protein
MAIRGKHQFWVAVTGMKKTGKLLVRKNIRFGGLQFPDPHRTDVRWKSLRQHIFAQMLHRPVSFFDFLL